MQHSFFIRKSGRVIRWILAGALAFPFAGMTQTLQAERPYEPLVVQGGVLSAFYGVPVDSLFLYAYSNHGAPEEMWYMIPFQIDERSYGPDPFNPERSRWFYIAPGSWGSGHDGVLSDHDELVFMARDLGDRAPDNTWIADNGSQNFPRLELEVTDPSNPLLKAYAYLYRITDAGEPVPSPYGFSFDPDLHQVDNIHYTVGFSSRYGLIKDIMIKPPMGTGVDFFDTQKIRFCGLMDLFGNPIYVGRGGANSATERDNLYLYPKTNEDYYLAVTPEPVVRLVREVRQTLRIGIFVLDQLAFYINTKFYPYSGTIEGGAKLDTESLKEVLNTTDDVYIELDLLRQSWDYSPAASGMRFYNKYNNGILIDGTPDEPDSTLDVPVREWSLVTGEQGSLFTHVSFEDTTWQDTRLYWWDNSEGGHGDDAPVAGDDTGDSLSYGDHGILFRNLPLNSASLELGFTAYFLEGSLSQADGQALAAQVGQPLHVDSRINTYNTGVVEDRSVLREFKLFQNHPNPFNAETRIRFELPQAGEVRILIFDETGRQLITLADSRFDAGVHTLEWNGRDEAGRSLPSGVYILKSVSRERIFSRKMLLIR